MAYECRIYDAKGKLKKIHKAKDLKSGSTDRLLQQKSTRKARNFVSNFRQEEAPAAALGRFYDRRCKHCGSVFHPRHPAAKYCSHECQKKFYYENRKKTKKR